MKKILTSVQEFWNDLGGIARWAIGSLLTLIAGFILTVVGFFLVAKGRAWIVEETQKAVQRPDVVEKLLSRASKDIVSLSYQAYFQLGGDKAKREHYIPIYVQKNQGAYLIISLAHSEQDPNKHAKFQIFVNSTPVETELNKDSQQKLNLTKYISISKDDAYTPVDEDLITITFRLDPIIRTKDVVSVKALVNVMGLQSDNKGIAK